MTKLAQHEYKMHVECVTNVTPTINDGEEIAHGIAALDPRAIWGRSRRGT